MCPEHFDGLENYLNKIVVTNISDKSYHCVKSTRIRSIFWSVFSCIQTEYGEILRISPYSVRMRENTDQKKLRIWTHFTQCTRFLKKVNLAEDCHSASIFFRTLFWQFDHMIDCFWQKLQTQNSPKTRSLRGHVTMYFI